MNDTIAAAADNDKVDNDDDNDAYNNTDNADWMRVIIFVIRCKAFIK